MYIFVIKSYRFVIDKRAILFHNKSKGENIMGRFTNKTVIITGGARGIGYGIATAFAKEGANLVLTSIVQEELNNAKQTLEEEYGVKVLALHADGGDYSQVQTAVKNTVDAFGGIDVLINNAQASKSGVLFADHSVEDFKLAIHSGLYAAFYYMKECFPYLKQSKQPRVINFASAAGVYGNMGQTSYAAAKEGIRGMSRVAAREWGELGITVNIICPLAMTEQLAKWAEAEPEMAKANLKNIALGRYGDPEKDIGRTCLFLASEDASYITGQTIHVDGGGGIRP